VQSSWGEPLELSARGKYIAIMNEKLREIYYSGDVQGVGFRATARAAAHDLGLPGYVTNLPDGRVKLVVEGSASELDLLEKSIADRMGDHISDTSRDVRPATGQFDKFEIRY
jgi:acylphosphatase